MFELKAPQFEAWSNGVTWIRDGAAFLLIAKGEIRFPEEGEIKYPLQIRRTKRGSSTLMWSSSIAAGIRRQLFPHLRTQNIDYLSVDTASIVDPLIKNGTLIMTHPADYHSEQDLYWADDAWYLQNKNHPLFKDQVYFP